MNSISICIATYKRPEMLKALLFSICETEKDPTLIRSVTINVVDNDIEGSSKYVVDHVRSTLTSYFEINFDIEPRKGISNVRNRLMENTLKIGSDLLIFVDDDEFVTRNWLNEMVSCAVQNKADVVIGPVIPVFDINTPDYITRWFDRPRYSDHSIVETLQTGNLLLRCSMLIESNIWFDSKFNFSGSEDTYFGIQLAKKGIHFYWSDKAVVYETIPETRSNLLWVLKRIYRGASTYTYILKIENNIPGLIKKLLVSIAYIGIGLITSIFAVFNFKKRYWGVVKLAEGAGAITGFIYLPFNEYR